MNQLTSVSESNVHALEIDPTLNRTFVAGSDG